jgi:hypothetical protein
MIKISFPFFETGFPSIKSFNVCVHSLYHWIPPWLNWHANHLCITSLSLSLFRPFCANWVQVLSSMLQEAISHVQVPVSENFPTCCTKNSCYELVKVVL